MGRCRGGSARGAAGAQAPPTLAAPLEPPLAPHEFSAINNREEGAGVLPTEIEDEFRVEDELPAPPNVFS